jgi:hypothetical protein
MQDDSIPLGFCQCGCGTPARIIGASKAARGYVKGEHYRYAKGHHRVTPAPPQLTATGDYIEDPRTGCWDWQRTLDASGYGIARRGDHVRAHRAYFVAFNGSIPCGAVIDHMCRNRRCVNPAHLEAVSPLENTRRGVKGKHLPSHPLPQNPGGLCLCGCGQKTAIAACNDPRYGTVKGTPQRFVTGHNRRPSAFGPEYSVAPSGCWIWLGSKDRLGYGLTKPYRRYYERHIGAIPAGHVIDHLCRNPSCVNPAHLEAVTLRENNRRGRLAKLTPEQVAEIKRLLRKDQPNMSAIARQFGVVVSTIAFIRSGKTWGDIP